jgi:hypothetical protein
LIFTLKFYRAKIVNSEGRENGQKTKIAWVKISSSAFRFHLPFHPKYSIFVINERRTAIPAHPEGQGERPEGPDQTH